MFVVLTVLNQQKENDMRKKAISIRLDPVTLKLIDYFGIPKTELFARAAEEVVKSKLREVVSLGRSSELAELLQVYDDAHREAGVIK